MLDPATRSSIRGATQLLLGRREALSEFDLSVDGFWHSFRAMLLALPFAAINAAVQHGMLLADSIVDNGSDAAFIAAQLTDYVVDWVAMPALLALFASQLGITRFYVAYIVVCNWARLVLSVPLAAIALLLGFGFLSIEMAQLMLLAILGVGIFYNYRIIRWTLGKGAGFAAALIAADLVLSIVLSQVIDRLFGL